MNAAALFELIDSLAFALAGLFHSVLVLLLLFAWRGRVPAALLILAAFFTAIWGFSLALDSLIGSAPGEFVEFIRNLAWVAFGLSFLTVIGVSVSIRRLVAGLVIALALVGMGLLWFGRFPGPESFTRALSFINLTISIGAIVLLEQIFRNVSSDDRERLRHAIIGIGMLFVYDIYVYSQLLLLAEVSWVAWVGRGVVAALAAPLIALSARNYPQLEARVYASRRVTFFGVALTSIGLYLIMVAAAGYAIRVYGGTWGWLLQALFLIAAIVVLVMVATSERTKRNLRVTINKHFYRSKYDYRREWLRFADELSALQSRADLQRTVIAAAARIVDGSAGALLVADEDTDVYTLVSMWPDHVPEVNESFEVPRSDAMVAFLQSSEWIIDVRELHRSPGIYDDLELPSFITSTLKARLILPLFAGEGLIGIIVLTGDGIAPALSAEDRDLLKTMGSQIATYLRQDEIQRRLAVSRQFEAYHRLSAFTLHDLNNIVSQLQLVLANAERHKRDPRFIDDLIKTVENACGRMNHVLNQLKGSRSAERGRIDLVDCVRRACNRCEKYSPRAIAEFDTDTVMVFGDKGRLIGALEHLVRNAQQATPDDGTVSVSVSSSGDSGVVTVADTGTGMSSRFIRERLFAPFDTTKGTQGMGIGAYQVRQYVRQMGGRVTVESAPGEGTVFRVFLPLYSEDAESVNQITESRG